MYVYIQRNLEAIFYKFELGIYRLPMTLVARKFNE